MYAYVANKEKYPKVILLYYMYLLPEQLVILVLICSMIKKMIFDDVLLYSPID